MNKLGDSVEDIVDDAIALERAARHKLIKHLKSDTFKVVLGFVLMILLFYPLGNDATNGLEELRSNLRIVNYVAGFAIATAIITHITRRLLFPYLDLKECADKAAESSLGAAIVFLAVSIIVATTIFAAASFFK